MNTKKRYPPTYTNAFATSSIVSDAHDAFRATNFKDCFVRLVQRVDPGVVFDGSRTVKYEGTREPKSNAIQTNERMHVASRADDGSATRADADAHDARRR